MPLSGNVDFDSAYLRWYGFRFGWWNCRSSPRCRFCRTTIKFTVYGILGFFVLSFILYAFYQLEADNSGNLLRTGATPALVPDPVQPLEAQVPVPDVVEVPPAPEAPTATVPDTPKATENSSPKPTHLSKLYKFSIKASLVCLLYFFSFLHCNSKPFPARGFAQVLNPAQAEERLVQYRTSLVQSNYAGDFHSGYCFKIRFRHMPRRGQEKQFYGSISGPNEKAEAFESKFTKKEGGQATEVFLLQNHSSSQALEVFQRG